MSSSPSVDHVREVIDTPESDAVIESAIAAAVVSVTSSIPAGEIPPALFMEIERWLAAHFVSLRSDSTSVSEEKIGEASIKYSSSSNSQVFSKEGRFNTTFYGRTAVDLDITGKLRGGIDRRNQRLVAI